MYVGAGLGSQATGYVRGEQLYNLPYYRSYWRAASVVPELPTRGWCVTQGNEQTMKLQCESGVRELAESLRTEDPGFAAKLDAAPASAPDEGPPRERARRLGESLWTLVAGSDDPAAARLLDLLRQEALRTVGEDNAWMCGEAIASLT